MMVAAGLERPTVSLVRSVTTERTREATVCDRDGQPLVSIKLDGPPDVAEVPLGEMDDPSALMTFYFGRGGRDVMLTFADHAVNGRLETCWEGNRRRWWLDLRS